MLAEHVDFDVDTDFAWLDAELFDDETVPKVLGPSAEQQWKMQTDPSYVSTFMTEQRKAEKEREKALNGRKAVGIMAYWAFCKRDSGYFHSEENAEVMFYSLFNGIQANPADWNLSSECFEKIYLRLREKGSLDLGPDKGYTKREIDAMPSERHKLIFSNPDSERLEHYEQRTKKIQKYSPTRDEAYTFHQALERNSRLTMSALRSMFPHLSVEQCADLADSMAVGTGSGIKRTWYKK